MKQIERLLAEDAIDPEIETEYAFITSVKNTYPIHCHDFFEIFLVVEGSVIHCINGEKICLESGTLVFIRPNDVHYYEQLKQQECRLINLSFIDKTANELFHYLGKGFPKSRFLEFEMPPCIKLSKFDSNYLKNRLDELYYTPKAEKIVIKAKLRALLAEIFLRYLFTYQSKEEDKLPGWFSDLLNEMKNKDNFTEGMDALLGICGKNHSYLCRVFKKYLGITPIAFINDLKFSYVESLILKTDMDILDVCSEVKIENVGYFYKEFKKRFHASPIAYRKKNSFIWGNEHGKGNSRKDVML